MILALPGLYTLHSMAATPGGMQGMKLEEKRGPLHRANPFSSLATVLCLRFVALSDKIPVLFIGFRKVMFPGSIFLRYIV